MTQPSLDLGEEPRAVLSECETYRYVLRRSWRIGTRALYVMLNPSTANAEADDPTIRKCTGFAKRLGFDGYSVVNLYAARCTKPKDLILFADAKGPDNDRWIVHEAQRANTVIVAWGEKGAMYHHRVREVMALLEQAGARCIRSLALTAEGQPSHPLMLAYEKAELRPWRIP